MASEENWFDILDIIIGHKTNFKHEVWYFSRSNQNVFMLTGSSTANIHFMEVEINFDFYFDDLTIIKKAN